jgi:uncharacterized membrane protein (UPF0136 family)
MGPILNILIGVGLAVAGLTGNLVLRGTDSGPLLALVGAALAVYGVYRLVRARSSSN